MESLTGALGIAYLTPTAEAGRFVRRPGDGLRGYALINGEPGRMALSLWLENGRPLHDRTGRDGFYYEAWLGDLSVGPFNADAAGHGSLTTSLSLTTERKVWPTGAPPALLALVGAFQDGLPAGLPVRVTVEPFGGTPAGGIPVLHGKVVWLGADARQGLEDAAQEALSLSGAPSLTESSTLEGAPMAAVAQAEPEVTTPEDALPPAVAAAEVSPATPPQKAPTSKTSDRTLHSGKGNRSKGRPTPADPEAEQPAPYEAPPPEGHPEPAPLASDPTPPSTPTAEAQHTPDETPSAEQATPDREEMLAALLEQNLVVKRRPLIRPVAAEPRPEPAAPPPSQRLKPTFPLKSTHPLARRVHASGSLDAERGALTIQVRSLPSPSALGKSEATGRPWSAYQVWLTHSRTSATLAAGLLSRGQVDQWRLEIPEGLPLHRFDTLLVCLDDRATPQTKPEPIVLEGSLMV